MSPTIGIYKIVNKITGKYYVGSSINTSRRWSDHVRTLKNNKHANDYLQNAWNKYGESKFEFGVVVVLPSTTTENQLIIEEQKWLDSAKQDPLTYNLTFVAGRPSANMSEYSKKKRSESLKKVPRTPEWKAKISKSYREASREANRKHWCFTSPDGKLTEIDDLKLFCRKNGLCFGAMYWVAGGKRYHHKGWKMYPLVAKNKYKQTPEHIQKAADGHAKNYVFTSPNNEPVYVHNLAKFCREHNLHSAIMGKVFRGEVVNHKGWRAYAIS